MLETEIFIDQMQPVTSPDDLRRFGDPREVLADIGYQVAVQIADYNRDHPGEMLPKTADDIVRQFRAGESLVILSHHPKPDVLFHGTIYENFTLDQQAEYGFQVVEFGSVITHPGYRGHGLGTRGCREIIRHVKLRNHNTVCLSTIKQELTARVLASAGMSLASFWDYPFLTSLTCTCQGAAECDFRRTQEASTPDNFDQIISRRGLPAKTPCSLMLSDPVLADYAEKRGRELNLLRL